MAMLCCLACRSQPTIFISASFVPSLFGWIPQSLLGPLWGRRRYDISYGRYQDLCTFSFSFIRSQQIEADDDRGGDSELSRRSGWWRWWCGSIQSNIGSETSD